MIRQYLSFIFITFCLGILAICLYKMGYNNGRSIEAMKWQQSLLQIQKDNNVKLQEKAKQVLNFQAQIDKQQQQDNLYYAGLNSEIQNASNQLGKCRISLKFLQLANSAHKYNNKLHLASYPTIVTRESTATNAVPILTDITESAVLKVINYNEGYVYSTCAVHYYACQNFLKLERNN